MSRRRLTWLLGFFLTWGATAQPPTDPGIIWDEFPPAGPLAPTDRFLLAQGVQGSQPNPFLANLSAVVTLVIEQITAPGSDTQVIFNDGGEYGADAGLTFNKTTDTLTILDGFTISPTLLAASLANGPALLDLDPNSSTPSVIPDRTLPTTGLWSGYSLGTTAVGLSVAGNGKFALFETAGQTAAVFTADQIQIGGDDPQVFIFDTDGTITTGENLYYMEFTATDNAVSTGAATLRVVAPADWDGGISAPTEFVFVTTPVGSITGAASLTINSDSTLATPVDVLVGGVSVCLEDGTNCPASGATPGGADTQVQYNCSGALCGESTFTYNETTDILAVAGGAGFGGDTSVQGTLEVQSGEVRVSGQLQTDTRLRIGEGAALGSDCLGIEASSGNAPIFYDADCDGVQDAGDDDLSEDLDGGGEVTPPGSTGGKTKPQNPHTQTDDGTPEELTLTGTGGRIDLPDDTTMGFVAYILGRRTDGGAEESAFYKLEGTITRNAGTVILHSGVFKTTFEEDDTTWDATFSADDTNKALVFQVTGAVGKTINWQGWVQIVEVTG